MYACCITGPIFTESDMQRFEHSEQYEMIRMRFRTVIAELIEREFHTFRCVMSFGMEFVAAEWMMELRREHASIECSIILPRPENAELWPSSYLSRRESVLREASYVYDELPLTTVSEYDFIVDISHCALEVDPQELNRTNGIPICEKSTKKEWITLSC